MAALTQEEEFFLRMLKLVNGVASKAVREKFNKYFPPSSLESILKREKKKIDYYHELGWISKDQMAKLFPGSIRTVSADYDITLMICLIRNLAPIQPPTGGWNKLPEPSEHNDGADIARVKYYRNRLAHSEKDTLTIAEFTSMWDDLSEAIVRLGGASYKADCDRLFNMNIDNEVIFNLRQELKDMREEMDKMTKMAEKCSCHDSHEIEIEEWETKNQTYVTIDALGYVQKCIQENKRVTVTGIPGVGKSALIQHVALSLRDEEGYDIIPYKNPSEIQTHFKKDKLQVFVANDVCGRYVLKQYEVDEWKKHTPIIIKILEKGRTILLSSCRLQIFKEKHFQCLELFSNHTCDLSSCQYGLSLLKKIEIANKYLIPEIVASINDELENCEMVPLLCSLCKRYAEKNISMFFTNPVRVYNDELRELNNESDKTKLCSLFFSLVYNGCISIEAISSHCRQTVEEIFETFGINRGTSTKSIIENLDAFSGTYLTKSGGGYKIIHDKLFDIFCAYFGEHYQEQFIKFAHSKVIYERTWLQFPKKRKLSDGDSLIIFVNQHHENDYFSRMLDDIRNGNVIKVFYSHQLENEDFRGRLIQFMQAQDKREMKTLLCIRDKVQKGGVDTPFHIVCALGYKDLLDLFLKFADNANIFASDEFPPLQQACYYGQSDVVQLFILNGADLNSSGFNGLTPLIWACIGEHLEIVKLLLLNNANVNLSVSGRSAILEACSIHNSEILDTLIKYGANIYTTDDNGDTPIIRSAENGLDRHVSILLSHYTDTQDKTVMLEACKKGCLPLVRFLIQKKFDFNHVDVNGMTGLTYACEYGHLSIVKTLIEVGCNFEQFVSGEVFPLVAACRGRQRDIAEYLIKKKINMNSSLDFGWTTLMEACEIGDIDLVNLLCEKGASINQQDESGKSPLMLVSERGDTKAVQLLIKNGANITQKDDHGFSAFILACDNKHIEVIRILRDAVDIKHLLDYVDGEMVLFRWLEPEYEKVVELLFELPLDLNVENYHGNTPLGEAIKLSNAYAMKYLLDKGATINHQNKIGQSPLLVACINKKYRLFPYLIDKGANISLSDNFGNSVLHTLCLNDKFSQDYYMLNKSDLNSNSSLLDMGVCSPKLAIKFCLDKGVDINAKNGEGQTPLMIACFERNFHLASFLVENGANVNISNASEEADTANLGHFKGISPLMIACTDLDIELVDFLITNGAHVNMTDIDGDSVVHKLYAGQVFVSQTSQEILDRDKRKTIARKLLDSGLEETFDVGINKSGVKLLITKDVEAGQIFPSLYAINKYLFKLRITNRSNIITDLFLDDAISSSMLRLNRFPLCEMIRQNYTDLALHLIESGANINETDHAGFTPLIISLKMDSVVAESLINRGVDLNTTDAEGRTPLRWAALNTPRMLHLLMAGGANVNERSRNGRTLLMWAFATNNVSLIDILIGECADISLKDNSGMNAIFFEICYCQRSHGFNNLPRTGRMITEDEMFFFNDLRSANEVIEDLMRGNLLFRRHGLSLKYNNLPDVAHAVTLFLKEGGWNYVGKWKYKYFGHRLSGLFQTTFVCKNNGCSEHSLLDYLYSEENKENNTLPCTLEDVKTLIHGEPGND